MISKGIKNYCKDDIALIENYAKAIADKEQIWECHHRRELETSRKELIEIGEYFNRPATELIFLTPSEHNSLHKKNNKNMLGKVHSEETKIKLSAASKGNKNRLGKHHNSETKLKISVANKDRYIGRTPTWLVGKQLSEEHKQKIAIALKGKPSWNKGKKMSEESRNKMSEYRKGLGWFNNGIINIKAKSCPEGFVKGMIKRKTQIT